MAVPSAVEVKPCLIHRHIRFPRGFKAQLAPQDDLHLMFIILHAIVGGILPQWIIIVTSIHGLLAVHEIHLAL